MLTKAKPMLFCGVWYRGTCSAAQFRERVRKDLGLLVHVTAPLTGLPVGPIIYGKEGGTTRWATYSASSSSSSRSS